MPFPWEQALQIGVQLGTQQAQASRASNASEQEIVRAYHQLNAQVAAFLNRFTSQSTVTVEQLNQAAQAFGQLSEFARQYGHVEDVAREWTDEKPRYEGWLQWLTTKLPQATITAGASNGAPVAIASAPVINGVSNAALLIGAGLLALFVIMKR